MGRNDFPYEEADLDWFDVELKLVLGELVSVEEVGYHVEEDLSGVLGIEDELTCCCGRVSMFALMISREPSTV